MHLNKVMTGKKMLCKTINVLPNISFHKILLSTKSHTIFNNTMLSAKSPFLERFAS